MQKKISPLFIGRDGSTYPYLFLQYQFTKGERKIEVTPHGNPTVSNRPFKLTEASTKQRLRELVQTNTPKMAVDLLCEQKSGLENIRSSGEIARNRQQAANFRRNVKEKERKIYSSSSDPLLAVMDRCKREQREPNLTFIREVSSAPEMLVVLANSLQLAEVKRFCTNPARFSVLGVDVTFNVGDFYVCLTTSVI